MENLEIFTLDRASSANEAILWLAATGARQIKYDSVLNPEVTTLDEETFSFKGRCLARDDCLYGMHFTVPVTNFKLWFQPIGSRMSPIESGFISLPHLQEITFRNPIISNAFDVYYSYDFSSKESGMFSDLDKGTIEQYKVLYPCATLGIVRPDRRAEIQKIVKYVIFTTVKCPWPKDLASFDEAKKTSHMTFDLSPVMFDANNLESIETLVPKLS